MLENLSNNTYFNPSKFNSVNKKNKYSNLQNFATENSIKNQTDKVSFKANYNNVVKINTKKPVLFATALASISSFIASIREFENNKSKIKNLTSEEVTQKQHEILDKVEHYDNKVQAYLLQESMNKVGINKNNCLLINALVNNPKLLLQYFYKTTVPYYAELSYDCLFSTSSLNEASYKLTMINEINKILKENPDLSEEGILNNHALDIIDSDSTKLKDVILKKRTITKLEKIKNKVKDLPEVYKKFIANYWSKVDNHEEFFYKDDKEILEAKKMSFLNKFLKIKEKNPALWDEIKDNVATYIENTDPIERLYIMKTINTIDKLSKNEPDFYKVVKTQLLGGNYTNITSYQELKSYLKKLKKIYNESPELWDVIKDKIGSEVYKVTINNVVLVLDDIEKFYKKNPEIINNDNCKKNIDELIKCTAKRQFDLIKYKEIYNHKDLWTNDKYANIFHDIIYFADFDEFMKNFDYKEFLSSTELLNKLVNIIEENDEDITYGKIAQLLGYERK